MQKINEKSTNFFQKTNFFIDYFFNNFFIFYKYFTNLNHYNDSLIL